MESSVVQHFNAARSAYRKGATYALLLCVCCVVGLADRNAVSVPSATAPAMDSTTDASAISIIPHDGFNLVVADQITPAYVTVNMASPVHNWFAGSFTNLPTDKLVTIGLSLAGVEGKDIGGNTADVTRWQGLKPVLTYGDPTSYDTYEWFQKDDQGRWVSGDPCKIGNAKYAGVGKTPVQSVIPQELAVQFLSADGAYWQPWREIDSTEVVPTLNVMRMKEKFAMATATVAMRIPFTYSYLQQYLAHLKSLHQPDLFVDEIGETRAGRKLQIIRFEPPLTDARQIARRPTILVYAREHATEQDPSYVIRGMVRWLLSDDAQAHEARSNANWLLIPILDVDGAVNSIFSLGDDYYPNKDLKPETIAYAAWLVRWLDLGHRLDIAINLHNIECNEGQNVLCPFVNMTRKSSIQTFNTQLFTQAQADGFTVGNPLGLNTGLMRLRLNGWCYDKFASYDLAFEVNSRDPSSRLSAQQLEQLGRMMADQTYTFCQSDDFAPITSSIDSFMRQRIDDRVAYWKITYRSPSTRNVVDLLAKGY
jgi:hypothetical protein